MDKLNSSHKAWPKAFLSWSLSLSRCTLAGWISAINARSLSTETSMARASLRLQSWCGTLLVGDRLLGPAANIITISPPSEAANHLNTTTLVGGLGL